MVEAKRAIVVGAGMGGLAAALRLAGAGFRVTVVERGGGPGGKIRAANVAGLEVDAGPTVFTMRWVLEDLFASAGARLEDHVGLAQVGILARHAWPDGTRLDLHADPARSRDEIARVFGPREGDAYAAFAEETRRIFETVEGPFLRAHAPTPLSLLKTVSDVGLGALVRIDGLRTMAAALAKRFADPRLQQLFGRYATYCGSSPYEAPATYNLVAHVEALGVHRVSGGMRALARAVASLAEARGVTLRYSSPVEQVVVRGGRVAAVTLEGGEELTADVVVWNGDVSALRALSTDPRRAPAPTEPRARSLSALTWAIVGRADGFPLVHHNVFFSSDYRAEFDDMLHGGRPPRDPTIYLCAQDRGDDDVTLPRERMLLIMNAPATGDSPERFTPSERERCDEAMTRTLERCGLRLSREAEVRASPVELHADFPATGGALYGPIARGATSTLSRHGARTKIGGLYLAGGSVHPGPGVPMAALSGMLAAQAVIEDAPRSAAPRWIDPSPAAATSGTTSTA